MVNILGSTLYKTEPDQEKGWLETIKLLINNSFINHQSDLCLAINQATYHTGEQNLTV